MPVPKGWRQEVREEAMKVNAGRAAPEELDLINKYTRTPLEEKDVYAFSVVLCDNEIDRDYERFSDSSLERLGELYVGVTGIADHEAKSSNQRARIFSCRVETVKDKLCSDGKTYKRLFARAYIPVTESSGEFIAQFSHHPRMPEFSQRQHRACSGDHDLERTRSDDCHQIFL